MTADEKLTSIPSGIRAACVADGYLVLLGMAFSMIGLSDMAEAGFFQFSFLSIDGIAWVIFAALILIVAQLYVIGGVWQIKPWAWTAGLVMFGAQALLFAGILVWVQLNSNVPVSYADGLIQWLVPLVVALGCLAYIFDQRSWYR
ncbi:hypothetical protein SAMN06269185_1681 [Natronoarchaeum philippinense]|uniref:Uncharacterized protein n=1 Tax=Natronoarchaeum philippinense TaxID=558529 RepID=A0A285NTP4_NATPI|nr:hypothetical protein [Natronoarchaeum philippinense]SNZ12387.1 hypothetical protein SAMN06269185_1681 [Natronoarchaeum philippinense]